MHESALASRPLPALVMLSPWGRSAAERWVAQGRAAAAEDLVRRLIRQGCFDPVLVMAAEPGDAARLAAAGATPIEAAVEPFHFGRALAEVVRRQGFSQLAYFGGGSAPLATGSLLRSAFEQFRAVGGSGSVVNNLHSTDWALLGETQPVVHDPDRFLNDNAVGWVISAEANLPVVSLPATAATRLDIDTPSDLFLAAGHPDLGRALTAFLQGAPAAGLDRCRRISQVLRTPASQISLIGRTSSQAWAQLETRTQVWVRVFAEERGMLASGRLAGGRVRSVLRSLSAGGEPADLVAALCEVSDAVLWDTRVWMAAGGGWPRAADRFAADLGWVEQIDDPALRRLSQAVESAPIPVLAGGHGVVAGGIYALLEAMERSNCA